MSGGVGWGDCVVWCDVVLCGVEECVSSSSSSFFCFEDGDLTNQPTNPPCTPTRLHDDGPRELQRDPEDGAKIVITTNTSLAASGSAAGNGGAGGAKRPRPNNVFGGGDDDEEDGGGAFGKKAKALASAASSAVGAAAVGGGKKSELERLMEMDAQRKQREEAAVKSKV